MVERKEYLDQLWAWKDERQIKVVTGIRRCGKSVLLEQYQQRLLANGVAPEQIISINFENLDYEPLKDYMRLYNYLKERLCVDKMTCRQEVPAGDCRCFFQCEHQCFNDGRDVQVLCAYRQCAGVLGRGSVRSYLPCSSSWIN